MRIFSNSPIPANNGNSESIYFTPDSGPWALRCEDGYVSVALGHVFNSDMQGIEIDLSNRMPIFDGVNLITLELNLENGSVYSSHVFNNNSNQLPIYREWALGDGEKKSVANQTVIRALIAGVFVGTKGFGMASVYNGTLQRYTVYRCLYNDLMLYQGCDGLIFLPAPYSIP
jgi:hypothetical protein